MGYTTEFSGHFDIFPTPTAKFINQVNEFADTRHGGNLDVYPGFPGFWCNWTVQPVASDADGELQYGLAWNGTEKFYRYTEWLQYLIDNFFAPQGYSLNGDVNWQGEDDLDTGIITVNGNQIEVTTIEDMM